jgi:hypothetical protein
MKIGFPIILDNKCHAVWIETYKKPKPEIKFNCDILIDIEKPSKNSKFNSAVEKLRDQNRSINFNCEKDIYESEQGRYQLKFEGASFGIALEIARHFELKSTINDLEILFSGSVFDYPCNPLPLKEKDSLALKAEMAINNRHVLVLHEDDYKLIEDNSSISHRSSTPESMLPSGIDELVIIVEKNQRQQGRVFKLPAVKNIDDISKWKYDEKLSWTDGVGSFLELTKITNNSDVFSGHEPKLSSADIVIDANSFTGKIGEIYQKALPNADEYAKWFLTKNRESCERSIFTGGVIESALSLHPDIFIKRDEEEEFNYKNILINGPTGCGKTFLAEAMMLNATIEITTGRAIYIGPTRSIIYENYNTLRHKIRDNDFIKENDLVCSTGEYSRWDNKIRNGNFKIALLVYEKANLFLDDSAKLLKNLSLVIIDEIHMITDNARGGVIDVFLAKIADQNEQRNNENKSPIRIVAISTESFKGIEKYFYLNENSTLDINASERPNLVYHKLCIYGDDSGRDKNIEQDLALFDNQNARLKYFH